MPKPKRSRPQPLTLSPSQQACFEGIQRILNAAPFACLWGGTGTGKSLILRRLHAELGGALITLADFVRSIARRPGLALSAAFHGLVSHALEKDDIVMVDDVDIVARASQNEAGRYLWISAPMKALADEVQARGGRLLLVRGDHIPEFNERCLWWGIDSFKVEDYRHLLAHYLGAERAGSLDCDRIYRFAPKLNGHRIKLACEWLRQEGESLDTRRFLDHLKTQRLASNVEIAEVARVTLEDLEGVDEVVRSLETHVILPLEGGDRVRDLGLQPRRGVLLVGPPGTGKTTVGRALANRLQGKFFMIDGTLVAGAPTFYQEVHKVFEGAKQNAPAVVFIDDTDAIFESGGELGLYRYLLTRLDGIESESMRRVCVIMTAMEVGSLPPALIRSGRIELWLEMKVPAPATRHKILARLLAALPKTIGEIDLDRVVQATDGFTGADLCRLADDGKALYAYDLRRSEQPRPLTDYLIEAVLSVRENKRKYREAERKAAARQVWRPPWFDHGSADYEEDDDQGGLGFRSHPAVENSPAPPPP